MGAGAVQAVDNRRSIDGDIKVQIQKLGFIGGETIEGVLHVNLSKAFPGYMLQVSLLGTEETHHSYIFKIESEENPIIYRERAQEYGDNKFLEFTLPVYDFTPNLSDGRLGPGKWSLPFKLQISTQLPSSYYYFQSESSDCSLKYQIIGTLISTEAEVRPLVGKQEIKIQQQIDLMKVDQIKENIIIPKFMCCCSSGPIKLIVNSDKASYAPGEHVMINVAYDLNSYSNSLKELSILIYGILIIKTSQSTQNIFLEVGRTIIQVKGKQQSEQVSILIPPVTGLTCSGDLINIQYFIEVNPLIVSYYFIKVTPVKIPIRINPNPTNLNIIQIPNLNLVVAQAELNQAIVQTENISERQSIKTQQQQAVENNLEKQLCLPKIYKNNEMRDLKIPDTSQVSPQQLL